MNSSSKHACRFILGAIFIIAGGMKIARPGDFFSDLLGYRVPFPEMFLRIIAVFLPWLEVLTGVGLLLNVWAETIRPLVAGLCLIFVVMLGQAVLRGLDLNCGCFGAVGRGWFERPDVALGRACLLLAASLYLAAVPPAPTANPVA
jgi:putative oxidoreductase